MANRMIEENGCLSSVSAFYEYSEEKPNDRTEVAFREIDNGGGSEAKSIDDMFGKLDIE